MTTLTRCLWCNVMKSRLTPWDQHKPGCPKRAELALEALHEYAIEADSSQAHREHCEKLLRSVDDCISLDFAPEATP